MLPAIWAAKLDARESHSSLEIAGLGVLFLGLGLTLINWRCPQCNRYLYRRLYPSSCPRCGVTFHD
jgi:rubrerythrin